VASNFNQHTWVCLKATLSE